MKFIKKTDILCILIERFNIVKDINFFLVNIYIIKIIFWIWKINFEVYLEDYEYVNN